MKVKTKPRRIPEDEMKRFRDFWREHPATLFGDMTDAVLGCLSLIDSYHSGSDYLKIGEFEERFNLVKTVSQQNRVWPEGYDLFHRDASKGKLDLMELINNCSNGVGYKISPRVALR